MKVGQVGYRAGPDAAKNAGLCIEEDKKDLLEVSNMLACTLVSIDAHACMRACVRARVSVRCAFDV